MNWGILPASKISNRFIDALKSENENVYAIASRDINKAEEFKRRYNIAKAYGSYDGLLEDKNVDIVYISNVNNHHYETVMNAVKAGKHVVCEKPMSVSGDEARSMCESAKNSGLFLMEALWTRFLPVYKDIHETISRGEIGEVRQVRTDFSFAAERDGEWRLLNPGLGGGALYDIGIYSLMFILDFMGLDVKNIKASGFIGDTGVDEESAVIIDYGDGRIGTMFNSFISSRPRVGTIIGTKGQITVPDFYSAEKMEIVFFKEKGGYTVNRPCVENKFRYQVLDVVNCIKEGKQESCRVPLAHSVKAAEIIDKALYELRGEL